MKTVSHPTSTPPPECYDRSQCLCPYCGHIHKGAWEFSDDEGEASCGACDKPYRYSRNLVVSYTTKGIA